jgi:hypothetical protein
VEEGYRFVADDMPMARWIKYKRLLKLIRAYLASGIMHEGVIG